MNSQLQKKFSISVIMLINNDEDMETRFSKFLSNSDYFSEHVELIIVDSECSDSSLNPCLRLQEEYPDNITYISCPEKN